MKIGKKEKFVKVPAPSWESLLCYLPWSDSVELGGRLKPGEFSVKVGDVDSVVVDDAPLVWHSHPVSKFSNMPSERDLLWLLCADKAKVSVIVCEKLIIALRKGSGASFEPLKWAGASVDKADWPKCWEWVCKKLGVKVEKYGRG